MGRLLRLFAILGVLSAFFFVHLSLAQDDSLSRIQSVKKIRIITDPNAEPMIYKKEGLGYDGFEYQIMNSLSRQLGVKVEIVPALWDGFVDKLRKGEGDIIMGGFSMTDEHPDLDYSLSYYQFGYCLVVKRTSGIQALKDLVGKKVGFYDDNRIREILNKAVQGKYQEVPYNDYGYFDDLMDGKLDAFIYDFPFAQHEIKPYKGQLIITQKDLSNNSYNIALKKTDQSLKKEINKAIQKIGNTGFLDGLKAEWFGVEEVRSPVIATTSAPSGDIVLYIVKPGDSLSFIAKRNFSYTTWQAIYEKNKHVIGDDPNLIYVGMRLEAPAASGN